MSTFLNSFDDSKRALAKLMARENITVQVVDNIKTADFNTVTRILRIPNWPSLTADQTDLLIGHEVGHALFTDFSYIEKLVTRKAKGEPTKGLMTYFNVIEDTRIERKMRTAFPGLRRSFYAGYQQFMKSGPIFLMNDQNEFVHPTTGETMPVGKMRLIDRINVHYKLGAFVPVPFAENEKLWLNKIDNCLSQDDALKIAIELHKLAKDKREQEQDDQKNQQGQSKTDKKTGEKKPSKSKSKSNEKTQSDEQGDDSDEGENGDDAEANDGSKGDESDGDQSDSDASDSDSDAAGDGESDDAGDDEASAESEAGDSESDGDAGDAADDDDAAADDSDGALEDGKPAKGKHVPNEAKKTKETDPYGGLDDPASFTDDANTSGLEKAAESQKDLEPNQKVTHLLMKPLTDALVRERTTTAKDWSNEVNTIIDRHIAANPNIATFLKKCETEWNDAYLSTAKHMAIEFSRKKTAKNLARVKIGKTGKINPGKLHAYKFSDDLFLRSMTVPNGQSHGIVMIIDASGSMQNVFGNVLDQVLLFANFAKAASIPFECYLFTTSGKTGRGESYYGNGRYVECPSMGPQTLTLPVSGRLVGLVNTMEGNFKKQMRALHAYRTAYAEFAYDPYGTQFPGMNEARLMVNDFPYARLGSTPLYAGLMIGERHLERMKRTLKLDKVMNIVITDGEDCENLFYESQAVDRYGAVTTHFEYAARTGLVVRDTVTKKNHVLVEEYKDAYSNQKYLYCPDNGLLQLLLDVNKERHDARNVFIFLHSGGKKSGGRVLGSMRYLLHTGAILRDDVDGSIRRAGITEQSINKAFDEDGQFTIPSKVGVADLVLVIPSTTMKLREKEFEQLDTTGMTSRKIAGAFVKSLTGAKTNRVFVNTVIPFLA